MLTAARPLAAIPESFGQRFLVTVDTEEEFDWSLPLRRTGHSTHHVTAIPRFQTMCESHGVKPVYLVDWPITQSTEAVSIIGAAVKRQTACIGMQLHPWVNPPFDETLCAFTSFAGNLPPSLERAKMMQLHSAIKASFGTRPLIYRAGRYGIGANTAKILQEAGIKLDSSVRTDFDYSAAGGVNFSQHPQAPYWLDDTHSLLELPLTTQFTGALSPLARRIYPSLWRIPRIRGVLDAARLLSRVPLTPEGTEFSEAITAINQAARTGLRLLVFSFHSPSLQPGHTPYIRTKNELEALYHWWENVFAHLAKMGFCATDPEEIIHSFAI